MTTPFRRILVPFDFSAPATQALRAAVDLAAARKGRLLVLHAIPPFYPAGEGPPWFPPDDVIAADRKRLVAIAKKAAGRRVTVDARIVVGTPYEEILRAARGVDAIVMATHGRTGLTHLVIGSVAEKVVRHATVPVLTIRPRARRRR